MISNYVNKRLEAIAKVSRDGRRVKDLYSLLLKKELWFEAYAHIASNKGAVTKGPDDVTQDGFSEGRVENLILLLREGNYHSKPTRRTYIPKANGKVRPLGIPAGDEKLVQEVTRHLLECVYEPVFSDDSHGFRPKRSCHTALKHILTCTNSTWFIEFDVKGFFDNIDHEIMLGILKKKIDDKRFIGLIKTMLRAGYLENWKFNRTFSGTPQGGVVSPILANIYLHELDMFIRDMQLEINVKKKRGLNPEAVRLGKAVYYQRKKLKELKEEGDWSGAEKARRRVLLSSLSAQQRQIPYTDPRDPTYRRLWYCRYADDFVLPFIGPRSEALGIKDRLEQFIGKELRLEASPEKTRISKASDGIEFLGYSIRVTRSGLTKRVVVGGTPTTQRTLGGTIQLRVPAYKANEFCRKKGYGILKGAEIRPRPYLVNQSEVETILLYNAEIRGLANYYKLAKDVKYRLGGLSYVATYSCLATLALKHKTGITEMAKRTRVGKEFIWKYMDSKGRKKSLKFWQIKHLVRDSKWDETVDVTVNPYLYSGGTELTARLAADKCEYCGREDGYFEVHHIRKLKDLKDKKHLAPWERAMIQRIRKTMVLCVPCHDQLHAGKLPDMRLSRNDIAKSK